VRVSSPRGSEIPQLTSYAAVLYTCIIAFAVYHHRARTAPTPVLLADFYAIPWFAAPADTAGLAKRNIHGLVISRPNAWGQYDFYGQRPHSPSPPFLATSDLWGGLDADCAPQGRHALSYIECGTTYEGKVPHTGFAADYRAPWARAAAAALVRGRHAPFPTRAVPALHPRPPAPVHAREAHRSVHPAHGRPDSGATVCARPAAPTPTRAKTFAAPPSPRLRVENWGSRDGTLASPGWAPSREWQVAARASGGSWRRSGGSASMSSLGRELGRTEGAMWVAVHSK
jgi:hypothetical protein